MGTHTFFVTAYLVHMSGMFKHCADRQLGPTWSVRRFRGMTHINRNVEYQKGQDWVSVGQWQVELRKVMGFTVETIYRYLIAFLTPLVLMQSADAMDLVQNCFVVSYIAQLDDLSEGRNLVQRLIPGLPGVHLAAALLA